MDYKKLGLKVGLELHQQLNTHKLFCECPSVLRDKNPDFKIRRKLKAVAGETGKVDLAAETEEFRNKFFVYEGYNDTTCLVELDEEPPHLMNQEALTISLQIAKLLNMNSFDEIQIMRKTVVDGSNTTGFQRTALVAENGHIQTASGKVRVGSLALEEDAARKIREDNRETRYRLDRLGIPLVELMTEPDIKTPKQAKEVAEYLGLLMRMTGKVKRGLGTVRQDVNVSIKKGSRVEIKGFQDLASMPLIIENEVERQQNLVEISKKLKSRKASLKKKFYDLKKILKNSKSNLVASAIEREDSIIGVKLKGFDGLLKRKIVGDKTLAKDIVDYLKSMTKFTGFIHTDELPKYGLTKKHITQTKHLMDAKHDDAFAFMLGDEEEIKEALSLILDRCKAYKKGVPGEVRMAHEDGTTSFLRPMPGAARMYPETDTVPIKITKQISKQAEIPERPEERTKKFLRWGLSEDLAGQILRSEELHTFESLVKRFKKTEPTTIADSLLSAKDEIRKRHNTDASTLTHKHFKEAFELLDKDKVAKEAVIEILAYLARQPSASAEKAMKDLKLQKITVTKLRKIIKKVLEENDELTEKKQFGYLMGFVMRKVRGRIDGGLVAKELKKALK